MIRSYKCILFYVSSFVHSEGEEQDNGCLSIRNILELGFVHRQHLSYNTIG